MVLFFFKFLKHQEGYFVLDGSIVRAVYQASGRTPFTDLGYRVFNILWVGRQFRKSNKPIE